MSRNFTRKPIGNFFIKKDLQLRLIVKIMLSVVLATLIFAITLLATYHFTYGGLVYYPVDLDAGIGERTPMLQLILLPLVVSAVLNIVVAFGIGLYASRKYAVPIYKLEQWAKLLRKGKMTAKLRFREKEEMQELSNHCNLLTDELCSRFDRVREQVKTLKEKDAAQEPVDALERMLADLELASDSIEVNTAYYTLPPEHDDKDGGR
jgi:methyl-accepting chemotaxis protein